MARGLCSLRGPGMETAAMEMAGESQTRGFLLYFAPGRSPAAKSNRAHVLL